MQRFMTVDCEEWFHAANVDCAAWDGLQQTVHENTMRLLELFARYGTTATFFTLGDVALKHPQLIETIANAGHGIASHGFGHKSVFTLTQEEFKQTVVNSKQILEQTSGKKVTGYRAPNFSITAQSLWALDILTGCGYTMDSSIAPIANYRYGISGSPVEIHTRRTSAGMLHEVPVSPLAPLRNIAMLGGFYFRVFPVATALRTIEANERDSRHSCFYIHPWEVATLPHDARIPSRFQSVRMRHNLSATMQKMEAMLREFRFSSISIP